MEIMQSTFISNNDKYSPNFVNFQEVCMLEQETGPCRGFFQRWHYVPTEGICASFIYGGCRGNRNNFLTEKECLDVCSIISG